MFIFGKNIHDFPNLNKSRDGPGTLIRDYYLVNGWAF